MPLSRNSGFALIATLSIMLLIVLLTVAMLSLATTSSRAQANGRAQSDAQANARLALKLAIGDLQKQMGPDQRISANGEILSDPTSTVTTVSHPHWTGVWDSWIAGDLAGAQVNSDYPSSESHHQTIGSQLDESMRPEYDQKNKHFRRWLLSLDVEEAAMITSVNDLALDGKLAPGITDLAIQLVGKGSLGGGADREKDYVSASLLSVRDLKDSAKVTGRYGWWVGDESQKASIMEDSYDTASVLTDAEKVFRTQAPGSMGNTTIKGLKSITDEQQLGKLPSFRTLDLVSVNTEPADGAPSVSQLNFYNATLHSDGVIVDVREGGLKRDLSTILEQPIRREDNGQEFMLYEFDDPRFPHEGNPLDDRHANSRVPIQDLAAYYQLYDHEPNFDNGRREGVKYTSSALTDAIQLRVADLDGGNRDSQKFLREYTALYKQPVITKIQFLLSISAQPITTADRDWVKTQTYLRSNQPMPHIRAEDTHKLKLGITPLITFWNPNNLPLVMDSSQRFYLTTPPFAMQFRKFRGGNEVVDLRWFNLSGASYHGGSPGNAGGYPALGLRFARQPIVFEPGEVKVFSIPASSGANLNDPNSNLINFSGGNVLNTVNEWDPYGIFLLYSSTPSGAYKDQAPEAYHFTHSRREECLVFGPDDRISLRIDTDSPQETANGNWRDGRTVSQTAGINGTGFHHYMIDEQFDSPWQNKLDAWRHNVMISRHGGRGNRSLAGEVAAFNRDLLLPGFPGGEAPIEFDAKANAMPGSQIIAASENGEAITLMEFSLSVGCETANSAAGGFGGGRRIASRPFLHSAPSSPPFIDQSDKASLYNFGWDWTIGKVNALEDSIVSAEPGTGNGYFGGGYSLENGTTHVVQREIPVLPPISIASLSHVELGGFSLAYSKSMGDDPDTDDFWSKGGDRIANPIGVDYQRVTATGQAGLAPHIMQAIGNSYAHPNIPADKAFTMKERHFDADEGPTEAPFVDHSYLANKALWDEFFFSSIAPQPAKVPLFGGTARTAKAVAAEFFQLSDSSPSIPLPNRRIKAYTSGLDQGELDALFAEADLFIDGLADKIAAHLMVEGAFNINSTSVDAWKIFLSSLKGKPVAYLNGGATPEETTPAGTTVSSSSLTNDEPIKSEEISSPNTPPNQWKSGRDLTNDEIEELAIAIVKQVKLRGPFLSLSEFVNRRLQSGNPDFAKMGALQAALNDPDVSINANFRQPSRMLDAETSTTPFLFPGAAEGPIAYGSSAYVDQADILRGFAGQLTPRGDTFVIRAYGDSLDSNGNVEARAWCEAVVQRVPEYIDASDEPHVKAESVNIINQRFGRKFVIKSFRWLNSNEV